MAWLAIKGHETRSEEVIEILKMFGNEDTYATSRGNDVTQIYYIGKGNKIISTPYANSSTLFDVFTLEEFLEKYPFKVGDKVKCWINGYCSINTIEDMQWDRITNEIKYKILDYFYSTTNIQPYKEEIMEVDVNDNKTLLNMSAIDYNNGLVGYEIPVGYEFDTVINNKVVLKKLEPQYQETFIEVSIIIDGVRYDAVDIGNAYPCCKFCELPITICESCGNLLNDNQSFKKSNKSFER